MHVYPGNYEDYMRSKNALVGPDAQPSTSDASKNGNGDGAYSTAASDKGKRLNPIKQRQYEERIQELEELVERAETAIVECETALANFVSVEETKRQSDLLEQRRADLAALMSEWEQVTQTLEEAKS